MAEEREIDRVWDDWNAVVCAMTTARYLKVKAEADRVNAFLARIRSGEAVLYPAPRKAE